MDALIQGDILQAASFDENALELTRTKIMRVYEPQFGTDYSEEKESTYVTDTPSLYSGKVLQEDLFNEASPFGLREAPLG